MAEATFFGYRLTLSFYKDGKPVEVKTADKKALEDLEFSFINKTETAIVFERDGSSEKEDYGRANLAKLNYHKQLYSPNCLNATLEFSGNYAIDKLFGIAELMRGAKAKLEVIGITEVEGPDGYTYSQADQGTVMCGGYVVYEAKPHFSAAAAKKMYVELVTYSPDKALDSFAYSKAYTGKALGANILQAAVKELMPKDPLEVDLGGMRVLKDLKADGFDIVQPYLVQYNETFYSFLSRVANRCGEFLYYEGDSLHLGINPDESGYSLKDFDQIDFSVRKAEEVAAPATPAYSNYLQKDLSAPTSAFVLNSELGGDEYFESVKKGDFTSDSREREYIAYGAPGAVGQLFTNTMGAGLFLAALELVTQIFYYTGKNAGAINDKFDGKYFKDTKETEKRLYSGSDISGKEAEWANVTNMFYTAVHNAEQEVSRNLLHATVSSDLSKVFLLGDVFDAEVSKDDKGAAVSRKYIVIDVNAGFEVVSEGGRTRIRQPVEIIAAPYIGNVDSSADVGELRFIPPLTVPPVRKVEPQRAVVCDVDDPKGLGRVRVRFCWQKKDDDPSPLLRVAGVMSNTAGGSAYFKAAVGDSAQIDFESGNADKPFVAGFLPTIAKQQHKGQYLSMSNSVVVSSENGQMLIMKDDAPDGLNMLAKGVQYVTHFIPGMPSMDEDGEDSRKRFFGSIELKDYYGLYSVKMSSTDKKVSVNSPFGTVDINAFTGITINAPNGDISLSGKNINIEARNNVNITSGTTCEDLTFRWALDSILGAAADAAISKGLSSVIDLPYIRNIIEIFIKPCEGTLSLKSGRNLLLNAGGGKAAIPATGFVIPKSSADSKEEQRDKIAEVLRALLAIGGAVNSASLICREVREVRMKFNAKWKKDFYYKTDQGEVKCYLKENSLNNDIVNNANSDNNPVQRVHLDFADEIVNNDAYLGKRRALTDEAIDLVKQLQTIRKTIGGGTFATVSETGGDRNGIKFTTENNGNVAIAEKLLKSYKEPGANGVNLEARNPMKEALAKAFAEGADQKFGFTKETLPKDEKMVAVKREMATAVLQQGVAKKIDGMKQPVDHLNPDFTSDDDWKKFVNEIFKEVEMGKLGHIGQSLLNTVKKTVDKINPLQQLTGKWAEGGRVWSAETRGRILLSDTEGTTMYFNNGQIETFSNSDVRAIKHFCLKRL